MSAIETILGSFVLVVLAMLIVCFIVILTLMVIISLLNLIRLCLPKTKRKRKNDTQIKSKG